MHRVLKLSQYSSNVKSHLQKKCHGDLEWLQMCHDRLMNAKLNFKCLVWGGCKGHFRPNSWKISKFWNSKMQEKGSNPALSLILQCWPIVKGYSSPGFISQLCSIKHMWFVKKYKYMYMIIKMHKLSMADKGHSKQYIFLTIMITTP